MERGPSQEIRDDEDDEDDLKKGLRMDDDDLLSLALHMSAQEAENKEYRRQVAALLAREPAGAGDVPGAEGGWQEEAEGRPGKEEAYCHEELEGLDGKKLRLEKEEAEGERKTCFWLEEEEELQLAMAMSLSVSIFCSLYNIKYHFRVESPLSSYNALV